MPFRYTWYYTFFVIILIYVITRMRPIATGIRASRWHFDTVTSSSTSTCPYHDFITITPIVIFGYFSTSFWTVKSADIYTGRCICTRSSMRDSDTSWCRGWCGWSCSAIVTCCPVCCCADLHNNTLGNRSLWHYRTTMIMRQWRVRPSTKKQTSQSLCLLCLHGFLHGLLLRGFLRGSRLGRLLHGCLLHGLHRLHGSCHCD